MSSDEALVAERVRALEEVGLEAVVVVDRRPHAQHSFALRRDARR
jgi:hypothetical protein